MRDLIEDQPRIHAKKESQKSLYDDDISCPCDIIKFQHKKIQEEIKNKCNLMELFYQKDAKSWRDKTDKGYINSPIGEHYASCLRMLAVMNDEEGFIESCSHIEKSLIRMNMINEAIIISYFSIYRF